MARMSKFAKPVFQILFLILVSIILNQRPMVSVKKVSRFIQDMRHILFWTKFPGLEQEGQRIFITRKCFYINCYFTTNRSLLGDLRYFDAIIFNVEDIARRSTGLPKVRGSTQKYIFAANDSADNFPVCSPIYDSFFNWTWTYRVDSSIPFKYITAHNLNQQQLELGYHLQWIPHAQMKPISKLFKRVLQTKTKAAAIFLNKCRSNSRREEYLKRLQHELSKYNLTVDVFGACGPLTCGRRNMNACFYRLKKTYYFYLALEDSVALDFMTAIVMNGLDHHAVPIVHGGAEYKRFLPPHSFLDATPLTEAVLAKTMYELIHNKPRYEDFFRWKGYYQVKTAIPMNVCTLCVALNNKAWLQYNVTYEEFRKWWHPEFEQRCGIQEIRSIF